MDQTFTSESSFECRFDITEKRVQQRKGLQGKLTMACIMQFARVYYVERKLPLELSGFVLN